MGGVVGIILLGTRFSVSEGILKIAVSLTRSAVSYIPDDFRNFGPLEEPTTSIHVNKRLTLVQLQPSQRPSQIYASRLTY